MRSFAAFFAVLLLVPFAGAKIKVVTTTTDLKALVEEVASERVEVVAIAKGTQDPHQLEAKPSYMLHFRNADLVLSQGLGLEAAWLQPLVQGARNPKIQSGTKGFFELGEVLEPIEVVKESVTRAEGDVHPGGNPHFQLDPIRLGKSAILIAERLAELDTPNREFYKTQAQKYEKRMTEKTALWKKRLEKTGITEVVSYHKTFSYFYDRFGIVGKLQLEPKPGIPPTASHLLEVIAQMQKRNIRLVLIENFFSDDVSKKLSQSVPKAKVYRVPISVGGEPGVNSSEALIENLVQKLEDAAK